MSLFIDPQEVVSVLIAGQWFEVEEGTFYVDAYEFVDVLGPDRHHLLHAGGAGFSFRQPSGMTLAGPIASVQAVQRAERT